MSPMSARFELLGREFLALNAHPHQPFTEAISFFIQVRYPRRGRLLLARADRGRRQGKHVRLAQGQVRRVVASDPERARPLS